MKKFSLLMATLIVATSLYGCSSKESSTNENTTVQENESKMTLAEVATNLGEEGYVRMPLEISEEEAMEIYHINPEIIEQYAILKTGIQPGPGFALMMEAKDGEVSAVKAIAEQVKQDLIGSAFYPDEVEASQNAEILVNGNHVALFVLNSEVSEDAIGIYTQAIK